MSAALSLRPNVVGRLGETLIQPEFPRIGSEVFEVLPSIEFECARRPHHPGYLSVVERCTQFGSVISSLKVSVS